MAGAQLVTWSLVKSDLLRNKELEHTDREILEKSSFEDARKELDEVSHVLGVSSTYSLAIPRYPARRVFQEY